MLSGRYVMQLACGDTHTCVVARDEHVASGTSFQDAQVFAWGNNASGQLGLGHTHRVLLPSAVCLPQTWKRGDLEEGLKMMQISAGATHTLAVNRVGQVWSWGGGAFGQVGGGSRSNVLVPAVVRRFDLYPGTDRLEADADCQTEARLGAKPCG